MSCASTSTVFRLTLLLATFVVSYAFVASVVWLLRASGFVGRNESYYLSRINISSARGVDAGNGSQPSPQPDHYKDLVKIEIAMRRVEENSRRLKEYTKSLLWDNKDKSLWCVLFKDSERLAGKYDGLRPGGREVDEEYIRTLSEHKMREAVVHLRHHGVHHRRHD
ncbi:hypothetical protein EVAR_87074_1 [Eumeta japonica]|uniref:Uncharacterized protein n=1 Tax=Eumeta variegata TaxID=151549 RepID=A0A4C1VR00_EUMVA|nr:hypothetical protein EVAR_87074_1 [Eumeta japonica]